MTANLLDDMEIEFGWNISNVNEGNYSYSRNTAKTFVEKTTSIVDIL
jgi:hypothetical protein